MNVDYQAVTCSNRTGYYTALRGQHTLYSALIFKSIYQRLPSQMNECCVCVQMKAALLRHIGIHYYGTHVIQ
jgi:hypothetical protein